MKILFAADKSLYSAHALNEVIKLAENTWADVTFLGVLPRSLAKMVLPGSAVELDHPLLEALENYRTTFLSHWPEELSPYTPGNLRYEWISLKKELWEQMLVGRGSRKDFKVLLRFGNLIHEILAAARAEGSDLIVLGCSGGAQCIWDEAPAVPQKVVNQADCSVLLVKEAQPIHCIYACLDESNITQESLEMINQMASIHGANVELVGLTKEGGIKAEVFPWLNPIQDYYERKGIAVNMRLQEISQFEAFIASEVREGLLALWWGKKSILDRFFPRDSIEHFVGTSRVSVLVLR